MSKVEEIIEELYYRPYYDTVDIRYIEEAVQNSISDFDGELRSVDEFDKHIQENYI